MESVKGSPKFDWIKEQIAIAFINASVAGVMFLIGYGIMQAASADTKAELLKATVVKEFIDKHNDSIKRESELAADIAMLKELMIQKNKEPKTLPLLPPPVSNPLTVPTHIPVLDNPLNGDSLKVKGLEEKLKYIKQYETLPNVQQRQ